MKTLSPGFQNNLRCNTQEATEEMEIAILYVDEERTTRDQRYIASLGEILPAECYKQVDTRKLEVTSAEQACDMMFEAYQAVDAPVRNSAGEKIRSMSVGDVVVIDGRRYLCALTGFKTVNLMVDDRQWFWDSRMPPTEVEVKVAKVLGDDSYEILLYSGREACHVSGWHLHHKPVTKGVPWQGQ